MDYNSAKQLISDLESDADILGARYKGESVWPILKYYTFSALLKAPEKNGSTVKTKNETVIINNSVPKYPVSFFNFLGNVIINYIFFKCQLIKYFVIVKKKDIVFIDVADNLYEDSIGGKKYSKYITPYVVFLKKHKSVLLLNTKKSTLTDVKYVSPYYFNIDRYLPHRKKADHYFAKILKKGDRLESIDACLERIHLMVGQNIISRSFLINELDEIFTYKNMWKELLRFNAPKTIFLICYYGNKSHSGMLFAAHALNIKTVEIQHGVALGALYSGYSNMPDTKYNSLPDFYWCWSDYDKEVIKETRKGSTVFMPITGGNLWFGKTVNETITNESDLELERIINERSPSKVLLVTLQHSMPLSDMLIEAIGSSPADWFWLIRFHPRDSVDPNYRKNYINELSKFTNVEHKYSTTAYLYNVLKYSNVHITHYSNIAVEALSFNISTILLGDVFENIFKKYIDSGVFFIARHAEDIIRYANNTHPIEIDNFNYFKMQYNESISLSTLNTISNINK